jgi:DNA-directed RNA polymerase
LSNLPIQLDASCNGFQHLSMLIEDTSLGEKVNLGAATWEDDPFDFYSYISMRCINHFEMELKRNNSLSEEIKESYIRLSKINFKYNRKLVKKTIMTIPYNATKYANIDCMKDEFYKENGSYIYKNDPTVVFKDIDFKILCTTLYSALYLDFPRLKLLLNYLKDISKIANKLNISIPWALPTGLTVKQKYYGSTKVKLKPFLYTKDILTLNVYDKKNFNTIKQSRALMPNLVHYLDAASLALLISNFFKLNENPKNFYSVHDCFAVTCNNVELIRVLLKLSYISIYSTESFIQKFDNGFKEFLISLFGANSYNKNTNSFVINLEDGRIFKFKYPSIEDLKKPSKLTWNNSQYIIL